MSINRTTGLALTGVAAGLALVASIPGASASTHPTPLAASGGYVQLDNNHSGLCAGVSGSKTPGARVVIEGCTGNPDREWKAVQWNTSIGQWTSIENEYSGLCLGTTGSQAAAPLAEYSCADNPSQYWDAVPYSGGGTLVNYQTGMCLSVNAAGTAAGTAVTQYPCGNYPDQTWHND